MKKNGLLYYIVCILLFGFYSCAEEGTKKEETIKIGAILPLTGDLSSFGEGMNKTLVLASEEINSAGGVLGKKVQLSICDDGTSPSGSKACFDKLTEQGIKFIIGPTFSGGIVKGVCEGAQGNDCPAVKNKKVLLVSPSATSPLITELKDDSYIWRTPPSDALQGEVLADYVFSLGITKVGVIYRNDAYGSKLAEVFQKNFGKETQVQVSAASYPEDATGGFSQQIQQIYNSFIPDGLVIISFVEDGINLLKELEGFIKSQGYSKPQLFGTDGIKDTEVSKIDFAKGMSGTAPKPPLNDPDYKAFSGKYSSKFGKSPEVFYEHSYDAFYIIALGIEAAGEYNPEKVKNLLVDLTNGGEKIKPPAAGGNWKEIVSKVKSGADVDYKGVSGEVDFDQNGDVKGGLYEIWQISGPGQIVEIKTEKK